MSKEEIEAEIKNITSQIVKKYKPRKVILFGSAVWGKFDPKDSDLDFFIIKEDRRRHIKRMQEIYRLVEKGFAADFIVYTPKEVEKRLALGDPFIKMVIERGRILYG